MKRNLTALLFILVSLMSASCSKWPFSNGNPVSETRSVDPNFRIIFLYNNVNVKLMHSDHPRLELTCPENLIDNIITKTSGDTLFVKNENKHNWMRSYDYDINLTIYYDSIHEISYASIGDLSSAEGDTLVGVSVRRTDTVIVFDEWNSSYIQTFKLYINEGSGNIDLTLRCNEFKNRFGNGTSCVTLRGRTDYAEYNSRSYGTIHAEELKADFVRVQSQSTNDIYINASNIIRVWLYSIGNVYYKGSASLSVEACNGTGRPIRLE